MRKIFVSLAFLGLSVFAQSETVDLTVEDDSNMVFPVWTRWLKYDESWYLVPIYNENGNIVIRRWKENRIEKIASTSPREGLSYLSGGTIDENGTLVIRGLLKPILYSINLNETAKGFSKLAPALNLEGDFFFWDRNTVVGGNNELHLQIYTGDQPKHLDLINRILPDASHPSQNRINHHKMLIARNGNQLAVGYSLNKKISVIHLDKAKPYKTEGRVKFRGYIPPPSSYIKKITDKADNEYMNSFHHLESLAWFGDQLLGFYRKGYDGFGIWASLSGPAFMWDNNKENDKLIAVSKNELVYGRVTLVDGEVSKSSFWRSSSLLQ